MRFLAPVVVAFLVSACGPQPTCVSKSGLELEGVSPEACATIDDYEDRVMYAFEKHVRGWTYAGMAKALEGVRVSIHQGADAEGAWYSPRHKSWIAGLAHCAPFFTIEVGLDDWPNSSLAHEMAHIFDACRNHCRWSDRGIYPGIVEAGGTWSHVEDC